MYRDFELPDPNHSQVYAYRRFSNNEAWVLMLNFSEQSVDWDIPPKVKLKDWVAGNHKVGRPGHDPSDKIRLRPWEGLMGFCDA